MIGDLTKSSYGDYLARFFCNSVSLTVQLEKFILPIMLGGLYS